MERFLQEATHKRIDATSGSAHESSFRKRRRARLRLQTSARRRSKSGARELVRSLGREAAEGIGEARHHCLALLLREPSQSDRDGAGRLGHEADVLLDDADAKPHRQLLHAQYAEAGGLEQFPCAPLARHAERARNPGARGWQMTALHEDRSGDGEERVALGGAPHRQHQPPAGAQHTPSTESVSSSTRSASRTRRSALPSPSSAARRRATSTMAGEKSVEIRRPASPTIAAASKPVSPAPAASSSSVSPGCASSWWIIHSRTGATASSRRARQRSQPGAIARETP